MKNTNLDKKLVAYIEKDENGIYIEEIETVTISVL